MLPCTAGPEKKLLQRTDLDVVFSILCGHSEEDEGQHDLCLQTSSEFLTLRVGRSKGPFRAPTGSAYGIVNTPLEAFVAVTHNFGKD